MNVKGLRKNILQDYLIWGFAFSVLLTLIGYGCDGYAQALVVFMVCVISGFISNLIVLSQFIRRYYVLIILNVIMIASFLIRGESLSALGMPISALFMIFAGYSVATEGRKSILASFGKFCVLIAVFLFIAILWHMTGDNAAVKYFSEATQAFSMFSSKLVGVYLHPVPAACAYLVFTLLCFLYIDNRFLRFLCTLIGVVTVWISASRAALIVLVGILVLFYLVRYVRHETKQEISPKTSKGDKIIASIALILLIIAGYINRYTIAMIIKRVFSDFLGSKGAGVNTSYRISAWGYIFSKFSEGSFVQMLFGRGYESATKAIEQVPSLVAMNEVTPLGTKNIYISMLYDYGVIGCILLIIIAIHCLYYYICGNEKMQRRTGLIVLSILAMGFVFDLQYWDSTAFILWAFIGAYLGLRDLNFTDKKAEDLKNKKSLNIAVFGQKNALTNEGGVEVVSRELARGMAIEGHKVTCYNRKGHHVSGKQFDVPMVDEWEGVRMKYVPIIEVKGLAAPTSAFFASILSAVGDYDVVHVHAEGPSLFCWIPKLAGKRVICHVHGLDHQRVKWGKAAKQVLLLGERNAVEYSDEMIVLSRAVQRYFIDKYERETVYIANAVEHCEKRLADNITEKWGLKEDDYILFLGRLVPEKGIEYLIRAYKEMNTDKKLVIAGGSSDTDTFVDDMKWLAGEDDRILFTGFVDGQLREELYSNAYIYVLPSDVEGMPLSLLEALSYGNCCLVSDIDECAEVVEYHGVIFKHSDIEYLKTKMEKLIAEPKTVKAYKDGAADFVCNKYRLKDMVDRVEKLYRDILPER
ncbi:MAG: glycosyltransferase [Lachnospiraceae bacterium]|nr:glycosyltransferase [Lachnospiraceae bacterium]